MEAFIRYILISTSCLSVFYISYLLFLKKEFRFNHLRYFLFISMVLSIVMPLMSYFIEWNISLDNYDLEEIIHEENRSSFTNPNEATNILKNTISEDNNRWNFTLLLTNIYFVGVFFFGLNLLVHLLKILQLFYACEKRKQGKINILFSDKIESPYSFFNWIFLPSNFLKKDENNEILTHEIIHASQNHSIDIILIELISAVMWFNPLVWLMRKSIQLVHEYLADEGVLRTGVDRLRYQTLLVNQVAEGRLICLSSNFNHSLIKKRLIMITKKKHNTGSKLGIITLIPVVLFLFAGIAIVNGQESNINPNALTIVVDAGHGGKDSGATGASEIAEKDLTLSIVKILKEKASSNKDLNLIFTRESDRFLELEKRTIHNADLLISIHVNSAKNPAASGIECFIAKDSASKIKSHEIGMTMISELSQLSGIKTNNSLKEAPLFILRESKSPALLLEIGYLSNSNDLSYLSNKENQGLICDKILSAISQLN